jgi:Leucine-rich repeat (LRR) protein
MLPARLPGLSSLTSLDLSNNQFELATASEPGPLNALSSLPRLKVGAGRAALLARGCRLHASWS